MKKEKAILMFLQLFLLVFTVSCTTEKNGSDLDQDKEYQTNLGHYIASSGSLNILLVCEPEDFTMDFEMAQLTPEENRIFVPWSQDMINEWRIEEASRMELITRQDLVTTSSSGVMKVNVIDRRFVEEIVEEQNLGLDGLHNAPVKIGHLASATHIYHIQNEVKWYPFNSYQTVSRRTLINIETAITDSMDTHMEIYLWDDESDSWDQASQAHYINSRLIKYDLEKRVWYFAD